MGLYVGAPKAKSMSGKESYPGAVFVCPLDNLEINNVTCQPLDQQRSLIKEEYFKDDMWYGATMAAAADNTLMVCAPRLVEPYENKHLANGACFIYEGTEGYRLYNEERQLFTTDRGSKDYGEYNGNLTYYAYAQAGMSAYAQGDHLIIGAPGVLQWTGAVLNYKKTKISVESLPTSNPAYINEINVDDYFGYSVTSGVFEINGKILDVASAPRSKMGYGQVLIFDPITQEKESKNPLKIKAKLRGPQSGAYFGAALCTLDLDGDGASDLLVGAPNYAARADGRLTYDQGAVFVYITRSVASGFILDDAGSIQGSGSSGARFGTTIADLGDIDGDGCSDAAIGAPWEDDGAGVVYIYRGSPKGLIGQPYQIIHASGAKGFGISISKGYDVDKNGCNDLAIGAHNSGTVYVYRSIPTIQVTAYIKVPHAIDLVGKNANNFTAHFCIAVTQSKLLSDVEIELNATTIVVDPEGGSTNWNQVIILKPEEDDVCDIRSIEVDKNWNLFKPIRLTYDLQPTKIIDRLSNFPGKTARLSESSVLRSSLPIHLSSDCGDDHICTPWLEMVVEPLGKNSSYIPGTDSKLGAKITVRNLEEPALGVKLHVVLPCPPKRLPSACSLQKLVVICDLPEPFNRHQTIDFPIELEYSWNGTATELIIAAKLEDPLYQRNVSSGAKELVLAITPYSTYDFIGKSLSNTTIRVMKETFQFSGEVMFTHYYEFTNHGPSDVHNLKIEFLLPEVVTIANLIEGGVLVNNTLKLPPSMAPANSTTPYYLPLLFNLTKYGKLLKDKSRLDITSKMYLYIQSTKENRSAKVTTVLVHEDPAAWPVWPIIVGVLVGLLVLAGIILGLRKFGFFLRTKPKELEENTSLDSPPSATQPLMEES